MVHKVTVMPGEGIGPEVMNAMMRVLDASGAPLTYDIQRIGADVGLSQDALHSLECTRVGIKGPTATPIGEGARSLNVTLREKFQLFANVRPFQIMPNVPSRFSNLPVNIVLFRENLEDCYIGEERDTPEGAMSVARFTYFGCERIAKYAFEWARAHGRKRVTIVHKANIMKRTHGLFLAMAKHVATQYPEIECDDLIVDNCCMQLVQRPERFDCILAPNFIGDILSDLCAGLVGGLGFAAGGNIGRHYAIFENVGGTAPDIAGKNIANPTAMILSGVMMLDHLGEVIAADRVRKAVHNTLLWGKKVTADVSRSSPVGTQEYADAIIEHMKNAA